MIVLAMPLDSGARIGPYEILSSIRAGGMGEVYRARDTRLNRDVAVKVLPQSFTADQDRLRRFSLEAQSASALNHPNILAIYDIGTHEGMPYLVSELLEGESLRARLKGGKLGVPKAVEYARQVASGLAAAHARGITHRDMKPENLFVTRDGHVKILDFGLAKVRTTSSSETQPTETMATRPGVVMGTVAYMSPEQVRGEAVDHRSDIFSFGCVLYEMLAGRRPFERATSVETMSAILKDVPPDLSTTGDAIPPALERVVRHCLEKQPEERFQSARDLAFDLEALSQISGPVQARARPIGKWKTALIGLVAVAAFALGVTFAALVWPRPEPQSRTSMRLSIALPEDAPLAPGGAMPTAADQASLALSGDGSRLVYVALIGGKTQLCLRDMNTGRVTPLSGTEGGHSPFCSPDGTSIGFFADGKLKRMPSSGGPAVPLTDAPFPRGGVWADDGTIYFNRYEGEGIFRIPAGGGALRQASAVPGLLPELLPGGKGFLATHSFGVGTVHLDGDQLTKTVVDGFGARYAPTGHLVYVAEGKLVAAPFSLSRVATTGPSVTLFEDVRTGFDAPHFSLSREGTLAYVPGRAQLMGALVWVDRKGNRRPLGLPEKVFYPFVLSPDGKRLAVSIHGGGHALEVDIWVYELSNGSLTRLSLPARDGSPAVNVLPVWTPDSRHIVYTRMQWAQLPHFQLLMAPADGSAAPVELWSRGDQGPSWMTAMSFSPDGSTLACTRVSAKTNCDIYLMRLKDYRSPPQGEPEVFLGGPFGELLGEISPDGHWMLYGSNQSGRYELYVTTYPKPGAVYQITRNGGIKGVWNPRAPEILFMEANRMYAVEVTLGPEFRAGEPRLLFEGPYPDIPTRRFAITPDGQEFLLLENQEFFRPTTTLTVVTNFFDELRRRAPAGGQRR